MPVRDVLESEALASMVTEASEARQSHSREIREGGDDGETWTLANIAPVVDPESGAFLGTVTVARDITAGKRVELLKAQFVNMVAHELRAPLAAVDSYLALLEGGYTEDPEKQEAILKRSRQRMKALMDLVGDLLNISRMEAGAVRREIGEQQVAGILEDVVELLGAQADQAGVGMECRLEGNLPVVQADPEELRRLFTNLVGNAVKYNRKGGTVTVSCRTEGPYVRVEVADTGLGISEKGMSRLFTEFSARNERKPSPSPARAWG